MPDIASALPLQPAAPQTQTGVAPIAAAPTGTDAAMPDFLGQLKAALKSLVTAMPTNAVQGQVVVAAATVSASNDQPAPATKTDDHKSVAEADLAEVVAAFGLVVTPTPAKVEPTPTHGTAAELVANATSTPTAPVVAQPLPQRGAAPTDLRKPTTTDSVKEDTNKSIDISALTPTNPASAPTTHVAKDAIPAATGQAASPSNPVPVVEHQTHQTHQPTTPTADPIATTTATTVQQVETRVQNGNAAFDQSGREGSPHEERGTPVVESGTPNHTFAMMSETPTTTGIQPTAQPTVVHPGEVVSQIAHQADLYKLPGNKGVRIQLHPEDLGGVQVTLRHATGGGLELHIAVEHAATGALVQAGWGDLRDALTSQGFSPDRLVMSVSAAGGSNQLDFSSNGGTGYRSDANLAAFADGGQSGQRRDGSETDSARAAGGWTSGNDSSPVTETPSRTTGVGTPSRIDYRV